MPRYEEWSLKERIDKKTAKTESKLTNCVECSFRMTKDIQFSRLKAYNIMDLVDICLDDSKLYSRRCIDVTNQKSNLNKNVNIDFNQIIQQSPNKYLVPSETYEDKLYRVDMTDGLCECFKGFSKGPCKHKKAVVLKYKMKDFEVLPKDNENMRAFYHFIATGTIRDSSWFRPLQRVDD